jgi:hypothetical protein
MRSLAARDLADAKVEGLSAEESCGEGDGVLRVRRGMDRFELSRPEALTAASGEAERTRQ